MGGPERQAAAWVFSWAWGQLLVLLSKSWPGLGSRWPWPTSEGGLGACRQEAPAIGGSSVVGAGRVWLWGRRKGEAGSGAQEFCVGDRWQSQERVEEADGKDSRRH